MAEADLPSRFVTQKEIETVNERKDEAWKAAYARIGQEPPQRETVDEKYDGRSLAEKLAANRAAKQEEFENSHKLSAQFRSLDPDEINFLDEVAVRRMEEERKVKEGDEEMLKGFRAAVQARDTTLGPPLPGVSTSPTALTKPHLSSSSSIPESTISPSSASTSPGIVGGPSKAPALPPPKGKSIKAGLKGVVVPRKRSKAGVPAAATATAIAAAAGAGGGGGEGKSVEAGKMVRGVEKEKTEKAEMEDGGGDRKRRRVE